MKLNQIYVLLLVVIAVFFAGCAKQESVATAGVVIEKFSSQVSTVASKTPVELTLIVRNSGEREAKDVKAVLGGLNFLTESIASREGLTQVDKEQYWRSENRGAFKDIDFLKNLDPPSLLGEDTLSGFQGGQGTVVWHLTSPVQARDQTYEPTVNLVYGYSTVSTILIKAVSFYYLQSLPEIEQKSIDTGVTVSKTTKGPIEISVKSDQAVISDFSTLPIEIEFKNVGGGRVFLGGGNEETPAGLYANIKKTDKGFGLDKLQVELSPDLKCNLRPEDKPQVKNRIYEIRLIEGKTGRILCSKAIGGISTVQTLSLDIKAEYRYLVEGKAAVKVSKTLYQPPIYDISLDVNPTSISHTHNVQTTAALEAKVTNVGNQNVDISGIKAKATCEGKLVTKASTSVPIVVLKYFPIASPNLNPSITGLNTELTEIRQQVDDLTQQGIKKLTEASKYHGYKTSAESYLNYFVLDSREFLTPIPASSTPFKDNPKIYRPDYMKILNDISICDYVDNRGARQVWIWGYHFGDIEPVESNMAMGTDSKDYWNSATYGDVSNSEGSNDMPTCKRTYTLYNYNYNRKLGELLHNHVHQIEHIMQWVENREATPTNQWSQLLFWGKFVGSDFTHKIKNPGCGWMHFAPNSGEEGVLNSRTAVSSDCENWKPDGTGTKVPTSCSNWGCSDDTQANFAVWWMQNLPGKDNELIYEDKKLRNWWEFYGDFDSALKRGKTFFESTTESTKGICELSESTIQYGEKELKPFLSEPKPVTAKLGPENKQIYISIKADSLKNEENTGNNEVNNKIIPLDYDIAVENLKAKVRDAKKLSVEIIATIVNNGKNVVGKSIPFKIKIDGDELTDYTTCTSSGSIVKDKQTIAIKELTQLSSQEITCIYDNPGKKLEFEISASVPASKLEIIDTNNEDSKRGENKFKIVYDLRLIDIKSEVMPDAPGVPGGFNKETGEVTYKLSAKVKNVGNAVANIGTVPGTTTDSTVEFKSSVREPLCQRLEGSIEDLEPTKVSGEIVCTTHPIKSDEFQAVARIIGAPSKPGKIVDEKTFTVISPAKSS